METKLTTRQNSSLLKKYFKEKYGIKVNVKTEFFSGGSSIDVTYNLGPSLERIEEEMKKFRYGKYNGMIDSYEYDRSVPVTVDGQELKTYKYSGCRREISSEFILRVAQAFLSQFNLSVPFPETTQDLYSVVYEQLNRRTIGGYISRIVRTMNFKTQSEEEIQSLWFEEQNINRYEIEMKYVFNEEQYSTLLNKEEE